jgi:hypothetical protein
MQRMVETDCTSLGNDNPPTLERVWTEKIVFKYEKWWQYFIPRVLQSFREEFYFLHASLRYSISREPWGF